MAALLRLSFILNLTILAILVVNNTVLLHARPTGTLVSHIRLYRHLRGRTVSI